MTFDRRLRAFSIDTSMGFFAVILIIIGLYSVTWISPLVKWLVALGGYLAIMIIPNFFSRGQTFGKRIQKLQVVYKTEELVAKDYQVPPLYLLILREVAKFMFSIATFGFYCVVAGIISTNRQDGRTIHDFIFRTRVIALTKYTTDTYGIKVNGSVSSRLKGSSYND
jgi:uncharacterized RDD family membrane protein YckC